MKTENGVTTYYIYGLGLIYETTDTDCKVYHYDYRGSTVALTNLQGSVTDTFTYGTYGKLTTRTGTSSTQFLYNGRDGVMSDENGLVYMRARYYSPTLKRFINADVIAGSITNAITLNRYAYANGNPVSNVDPLGLSADEARGTQGTAISTDSGNNGFDISEWYTDEISNAIHTLLDLAGFIPGFGSIADALNALVYAFEGDWINAGMSAFAALPGIGDIAAGCKWATKFFKASSKIGRALESVSTILSKTDEMIAAMTSFGRIGDDLSFVAKNGENISRGVGNLADEVVEHIDIPSTTTTIRKTGWNVGDDISNLTKAGNEPSWTTVRNRYWKNEAHYNSSAYSLENITRMQNGRAPIGTDTFSMELHHPNGRTGENFWNFYPTTRTEHRRIHYGNQK